MVKGLVSIIIPAYNSEKFICRSVDSAIAQSYGNIEIIVVNDGSTDATSTILEQSYRQEAKVRIFHISNSGVSYARNFGIEKSTGEYVCFLDADDELLENAIEIMLATLLNNAADICVAKELKIIQNPDGTTAPSISQSSTSKNISIYSGTNALIRSIEGQIDTTAVWGKLYKREVIGETRFPVGMRAHEDGYFVFLLLAKKVTMTVIPDVLYKYYLYSGSTTTRNFTDKYKDILQLAENKMEILKESYPELLENSHNIMLNACVAVLANTARHGGKKYRVVEKKCKKYITENKTHYIPIAPSDFKVFKAVINHLYSLYKIRVKLSLFIKKILAKL